MKRLNKQVFIALLLLLPCLHAAAQKEMAITMDDPTTKQTPLLSWEQRDSMIRHTLDKHKIKAALFVCGMRVDDSDGRRLLNNWDKENHLICNHSYSHLYFNGQPAGVFIEDFYKGDSIIRHYKNYTRLFRFPYLKEGNTASKRDSMRAVMAGEGYKNGQVTIDASDWYIDAQMTKALEQDAHADLRPYKEYYIHHITGRAQYYDSLARLVWNRPVKHTLLIHHSLLNALFLDELLAALEASGWQLADAREAFRDPVFSLQPAIAPCGESIIWQCASQQEQIAPTLRYPAEDGAYEKEALEKYIQAFHSKQ